MKYFLFCTNYLFLLFLGVRGMTMVGPQGLKMRTSASRRGQRSERTARMKHWREKRLPVLYKKQLMMAKRELPRTLLWLGRLLQG